MKLLAAKARAPRMRGLLFARLILKFDTYGWFVGAGGEHAGHGVVFGWGDPETVFVFNGDLPRDILTAKSFIRREPSGGVAVGFALVGASIDRE